MELNVNIHLGRRHVRPQDLLSIYDELLRSEGIDPTKPPIYPGRLSTPLSDVLEVEEELLRSEGVDPAWPGFTEAAKPPDACDGDTTQR